MPCRYFIRNFKPNTYHHIFNRGAFKHKIFRRQKDYETFINILQYYLRYPQFTPLSKCSAPKIKKHKAKVKPYLLLAYCLMPNHFHLLLKQTAGEPTLTDFMRKISITYAMYFQHQYQHSGTLFEGKFRCTQLFPDDSLLYVSKYIHLNPKKLEGSEPSSFKWSSLKNYLENNDKDWLHPEVLWDIFYPKANDPRAEYRRYVFASEKNEEKEALLRKMEGSEPSL